MTTRIVVDSTSDIDPTRAKQYGITVVPLTVAFGDDIYRDGIDIDNKAFYEKLSSSPALPITSTPTVAQFEEAYRKQIQDGATSIISLHISGALSGTINAASLAATTVSEEKKVPIEVIDGRSVSVALAVPAVLAAKRALEGAAFDDLTHIIQRMIANAHLYFVLDTLEYLEKGGRIGRAQALVGTMLSIKPILTIKDGVVAPLERVRSRPKALTRMAEILRDIPNVEHIGIAASDKDVDADMRAIISQVFPGMSAETYMLGAIIGTHAGPRAAGIYVTSTK
jgi:DegV family protein with EDD domain